MDPHLLDVLLDMIHQKDIFNPAFLEHGSSIYVRERTEYSYIRIFENRPNIRIAKSYSIIRFIGEKSYE